MTTQPNGTTAPSPVTPKSSLSISLTLNVNDKYGQSTLSLVQEALVQHRQTCLNLFFDHLRAGEYQAAYPWYQSAEDLSFLLDTILSQTIELAALNYYAEEVATNPGGFRSWVNGLPADKSGRYGTFLKMVMPDSEFDEPGQPATESEATTPAQ